MKTFTKVSVTVVAISSALILVGPLTAFAATAVAPDLGAMSSFSILSALSMSSANITTISGDLGLSPGVASSKTGTWVHTGGSDYFGTGGLSASAQTSALNAYNSLVSQTTSGVWSTNTNGINSPLPGVWTETGSPSYSGTLTLTGNSTDVWVFQISTDFTFAGSVVMGGTANACNVFWAVAGSATITSGSPFIGTLIASSNVTSASGSTINGRLVSLNGYIHMDGANSSISGCAAGTLLPSVGSAQNGTITVVKKVINDNGGTKTVASFPLFVNGIANGHQPVISGETNTFFTFGLYPYTVTETSDPNYTATFSGDCDATGFLNLAPGDHKTCTITNNDKGTPPALPATITVVKKVINDNGGTRTVASFPLSVNGMQVVSGGTNAFPVGTYTVNEIGDSNYTRTFSGDCNSNGVMNLVAGDHKTCTITNNDSAAVITPKLPNTGYPTKTQMFWNGVMAIGTLVVAIAVLAFFHSRRKI